MALEGEDEDDDGGLFWRETDEDSEAAWPFSGEPETQEALQAAAERVPKEGGESFQAPKELRALQDSAESLLQDDNAPDTSLDDIAH